MTRRPLHGTPYAQNDDVVCFFTMRAPGRRRTLFRRLALTTTRAPIIRAASFRSPTRLFDFGHEPSNFSIAGLRHDIPPIYFLLRRAMMITMISRLSSSMRASASRARRGPRARRRALVVKYIGRLSLLPLPQDTEKRYRPCIGQPACGYEEHARGASRRDEASFFAHFHLYGFLECFSHASRMMPPMLIGACAIA